MEVVYSHCCGVDVHKNNLVACLIVPDKDGKPIKEIRTFQTLTDQLLEFSDWLSRAECTHVAMESTGVYWKPIYNILEGDFEVLLVNARHIKAVPGRKSDVRDCEWIADLLRHGLVRGSFVPDRPQRELRELTRYRTSLTRERTAEVNRLQKVLEGANIKLASVASSVMGASGREMLEELAQGSSDVKAMAELARGKLREKIPELERALQGRFAPHQRFMLLRQLAHIDFLDETIGQLSEEIEERMRPFEEELERLDEMPGINRVTAEVIIAEIGVDMSRFPSARHLSSWAGMVPGNDQSAGKVKSNKIRDGSKWLRSTMVEVGMCAARKKDSYFSAQYRRIASRRGKKKAAVAVGHAALVAVYYILKDGTSYQELGGNYFDERDREAVEKRLVSRLERLGYKVSLEKEAA